jgi:selenocysteine lyase/cysteine desulfurase
LSAEAPEAPATAIACDDERYWAAVREQYAPSPDFINLENGYFGMPAEPVRAALRRYQDETDREGAFFLRVRYPERHRQVLGKLAAFCGVAREELVLTRSAVESFNILIQGYPFQAGDEVLLAGHDYDSVIATLGMLEARKGIRLGFVDVPLDPASDEAIVDLYERAIGPRTRVVVLTHVVHRTGQVMPVAHIAAMARRHGVDVVVDAAHSLGLMDYHIPELGAPFGVFNLHKWVGAPLGVGLLYIARERIADIAPLFGDVSRAAGDIGKLAHFGVVPPAPMLAVEEALDFCQAVGVRNKEARLRYLSRYWMDRVRDLPGVRILTPRDPGRYCALGAFAIEGMPAQEVAQQLMSQHRVFTVVRKVAEGPGAAEAGRDCVRVTPHLYTRLSELDVLVGAIRSLARQVT